MDLIFNEQVKLAATFWNNVAAITFVSGFILPMFNQGKFWLRWRYLWIAFALAAIFHGIGYLILRQLTV